MNKSRFKFRVWDKKNKDMICWPRAELYEEFFLRADGVLCLNADNINGDMVEADNDRFELIQSTDLQDCEGKEIWEGDILGNNTLADDKDGFTPSFNYLISFKFGASVGIKKGGLWDGLIDYLGEALSSDDGWRVIGNRFEHPELLEEKE